MEHIKDCIAALREAAPEIDIAENELMRRYTTFAIGGPADLFVQPKTRRELTAALAVLRERNIPFLLLGNGSNMLVAEAGALLSRIARRAQRSGLTGAEFAGGIPGSLGGAVYMNAGAYDGTMAGIVQETEFVDGEGNICTLKGDEHGFDYRTSVFRKHPDWTVLRSTMQLQNGDSAAILDKMNDFAQRRRDKQPLNFPSAGSTFKRPVGHFAGQLIEQAGLKGTSVGAAQVSEKHAGFLINRGGATCDDMLRLIELVQNRVREQFGVELECEVRIVK